MTSGPGRGTTVTAAVGVDEGRVVTAAMSELKLWCYENAKI